MKNMSKPYNEEFIERTTHDSNLSKIQNAVRSYPNLINVKAEVTYNLNVAIF